MADHTSTGIVLSATDHRLPDPMPVGLAKYTNFKDMAEGGSGKLRSCWDTVVNRLVVMKTLQSKFIHDPKENRRFLREARITAMLQHPNTVPVYEIGHDPEIGIYFTMKRISGENFFQALKRIAMGDEATAEAYSLQRRLEIAISAAQALAYAHVRGVIHRDVKPENIWIGNFGEVILLDWGVAKVWGHSDESESFVFRREDAEDEEMQLRTLTGGGQRPGTPLYMSPEQVRGYKYLDERSDIFSMGIVLYEMLAIREPFRGRNINETFDNIQNVDPPPPSERSPDREIPAAADAIVMRAIQKKPKDRYQSMRAMIADLHELLENRKIE
ncbi:Serine/threonine-protein kinase PknD [Rosistilla carotiformis]|uniref:Serine/threonine-protein kinase PknD n=1 Tax=Rosistilla carotiformis TaxID=2528017 RepID=A0A518JZ18_9BACT|nr:serine/threonine-protein kinase [Rosistilla carotiformis]QDV70790.1 Serine/threonine-protein kinase PknD [Rosistilla carotiformis]